MKKLLLAISLISSFNAIADDDVILGQTYEIKEPSIIDTFINKLKEKEANGELAKMKKEFVDNTINSIRNPKGIELPEATKTYERNFNTEIVIERNITLPDGRVLYPAGTLFNPLLIKGLSKRIIFIDGRDEKQVEYAISEYYESGKRDRLVLTNGSYMDLMKEHKVRFFYDSITTNGAPDGRTTLVKHFGIKALPSVVYQETIKTPYLTIKEVHLK